MKKSAILQMFDGERGCHEFVKPSREYFDILNDASNLYDKMLEKLKNDPELLNLFKKFDDKMEMLNCQSNDEFYLEGFRFGAQVGIDIMTEPSRTTSQNKD